MSDQTDKKSGKIPDSDTKHARGSKSVHSKRDQSTEDGFVPKALKKNSEEEE